MPYTPYDDVAIQNYARKFTQILHVDDEFNTVEIGDGNLNLVFRVQDQHGHSVIFKQALPYARVVGESWPLTIDRSRIEFRALSKHGELAPGLVPKLYAFDAEQATIAMEDLSSYSVMRKALIDGYRGTKVYGKLGEYMARTLFFTSDLVVDPPQKKRFVQDFINPDLCRITELLIFTDPYYDAETNSIPQELRQDALRLWTDTELKNAVAHLKMSFLTRAEALLHGDLHTGSIMVQGDEVRVFDSEFAYYGPIGFDVGLLIGNLILNLCANAPRFALPGAGEYWYSAIAQVWNTFSNLFTALWDDYVVDPTFQDRGFRDWYMTRLLQDTIGFAGAEVIRRTIGLAHVQDLDGIADTAEREQARRLALQIGRHLIVNASAVVRIDSVVDELIKWIR